MSAIERLLLLRHARAGEKLTNPVLDFDRELDHSGGLIAARLPGVVVRYLVPEAIISSPYRRCIDTVRPLSTELRLSIHEDERLAGNRTMAQLQETLRQLPANAVACTHGEIIETVFAEAISCAKGAFWIIERSADGHLVPARYVEPQLG